MIRKICAESLIETVVRTSLLVTYGKIPTRESESGITPVTDGCTLLVLNHHFMMDVIGFRISAVWNNKIEIMYGTSNTPFHSWASGSTFAAGTASQAPALFELIPEFGSGREDTHYVEVDLNKCVPVDGWIEQLPSRGVLPFEAMHTTFETDPNKLFEDEQARDTKYIGRFNMCRNF